MSAAEALAAASERRIEGAGATLPSRLLTEMEIQEEAKCL